MPKRQATRRVDSEKVMGDDSYVVLRSLKYGNARKIVNQAKEMGDEEAEEAMNDLLKEVVAEWNWVDDEGDPLPLPSEGLDVNDLYPHEINFLVNSLVEGSDQKN